MARNMIMAILFGCGRLGFDARSDAGDTDGRNSDAQALTCTTYDFNTGLPSVLAEWNSAAGFAAIVTNQRVEIQLAASANGYAGVTAIDPMDLRGSSVTVEAPGVPGSQNAESYLMVWANNSNLYLIDYQLDNLWFGSKTNDVDDEIVITYDGFLHRFWRIAHQPATNRVSFSSSDDGVGFVERYSVPVTVPLDALTIEVAAGTFGGGDPIPGTAAFDNLEVCVP